MEQIILILKKLDKISYNISRIGAVISGVLIALIALMIFCYIINRQFIGYTWLFVEEWAGLSMVPMTYLALAYTLRWNQHIYVDALVGRFSLKTQNIIGFLVSLLSLIILGFIIERSVNWFMYTWIDHIASLGPMRTPLWPITISIVVGSVMYFIDTFFFMVQKVLNLIGRTDVLNFHE